MKRLTATRALELTVDQWLLILQGMNKMDAARKVAPRNILLSHSCFLCEYSQGIGDEAYWEQGREKETCPHCPWYMIVGHCVSRRSPYKKYCNGYRDPESIGMILSAILGIQAEWKRIHGRKGLKEGMR